MKNPYHDQLQQDEVRLGRLGLLAAAVVFAGVLLYPWAETVLWDRGKVEPVVWTGSTIDKLKSVEGFVENLPVFERERNMDQALLTRYLGLGNRKVVVGEDGWLFYRPDLEAVFGKGPFYREPPSVARERVTELWHRPVEVIEDFAKQLEERGIRLLFVPVPTKPMVCNLGLGLDGEAIPNPDWNRVKVELAGAGVDFVDLMPVFESITDEEARFLKQDTHWTPLAMEKASVAVAARMANFSSDGLAGEVREVERSSEGDLAKMLVKEETSLFGKEKALLRMIDEGPPIFDEASPVVVLGDSFVNIYRDPNLGFARNEAESMPAGFASHLASKLGRSVNTIASNGGGATEVRKNFARLGGEAIGKKKVVVWVLSARDLLLPEVPARRAGIRWTPVNLPEIASSQPEPSQRGSFDVVAIMKERSALSDPKETPYDTAIYSAIFEVIESGGVLHAGDEVFVYLWGFRKRELEPTARFAPGHRYRLSLETLHDVDTAMRATQIDDLFRVDLTPYFATRAEEE